MSVSRSDHRPTIVVTGPDDVLDSDAVAWALDRLRAAARPLGIEVGTESDGPAAATIALRVATAADGIEATPESYRFTVDGDTAGVHATVASYGERGFVYALTEAAERITAARGLDGIVVAADETHVPRASIRAMCRSFSNVHHDLPWFRDRSFWPEYLDHLAMQRFNRFHLAFGMHYNYGFGATGAQTATDNYLCFAYPFLLDVPGFEVRAQGVSDEERHRNLAALTYIARETRRRGMSFQLGLWNHAFDYGKGSDHWYPILGIGRETHAAYSAAAVAALLEAIPEIGGVTFRVHYEGGIPDGHGAFWETVFQAVSDVRRPIDVDLHAKGVDQAIVDAVAKPNIRATLSAKYAAEHMALPYHQASIRPFEAPMSVPAGFEMMGTAEFSRRFTRYGYADFMGEDRPIDVAFRMWPGTQRLLLWGDPAFASGYGRFSTFAGSRGLEVCEPLYFKGRKGSGVVGGRDPYVDDDLRLGLRDWRKYRYAYVLWGRLLYDPDAEPETWRRHLRDEYGAGAADIETALAPLSRVLPLVTHAHMPSASNNTYWPELYFDLPISSWLHANHYAHDTPHPTNWGSVSPLDPTMFYGVNEYVDAALAGTLSGRYTPLEVATWMDRLVDEGQTALDRARTTLDSSDPQCRRTVIDLQILARLGRFFAGKFRAAVEYAFYERTGDAGLLAGAIALLENAHTSYASIREVADVYQRDLVFGERVTEGGHWADRLAAMADDLRLLRLELDRATEGAATSSPELERRTDRWRLEGARFDTPPTFRRGQPLEVRLRVPDASTLSGAVLRYRRVDQSDVFRDVDMKDVGDAFAGSIPGDETDTTYPLMYFVELRRDGDHPILFPGLDDTLSNQPYALIHSDAYEAK